MKGFNRFLGLCLMLSMISLAVMSCNSSEQEENAELNTLMEDELLLRSNKPGSGGGGGNGVAAREVFHLKAACTDPVNPDVTIDEYYKTMAICQCYMNQINDGCTSLTASFNMSAPCSQVVRHVIPIDICPY